MKRRELWAACVVLVLIFLGGGVLAGGAGHAKDDQDEDAVTKCSKATLDGQYLFAQDGFERNGKDQGPFALAGYEVFDGNGKVDAVFSSNFSGNITRKAKFSGTYTVKADCTGTTFYKKLGVNNDLFIAPDGSMFTFVNTNPPEAVTAGFELQATAKRVGD